MLRDWVDAEPLARPAVRALVLDSEGRTLLLRWPRPGGSPFWIAPGGGVEAGESDDDALRRELREELGLEEAGFGPCIWTREFTFPWRDRWWRQAERYHVVRLEPDQIPGGEEAGNARWWSADEIEASDELFAPARLAELLRDLEANGPPPRAIDVGI